MLYFRNIGIKAGINMEGTLSHLGSENNMSPVSPSRHRRSWRRKTLGDSRIALTSKTWVKDKSSDRNWSQESIEKDWLIRSTSKVKYDPITAFVKEEELNIEDVAKTSWPRQGDQYHKRKGYSSYELVNKILQVLFSSLWNFGRQERKFAKSEKRNTAFPSLTNDKRLLLRDFDSFERMHIQKGHNDKSFSMSIEMKL